MPTSEKQVRVFISSTFRDMHAERDHLVTVVFPELRERIESLGLEFFDVDLRWGVPEKTVDGETANSWEYCRQWIDRVEPFFVCILGQRYGWVPEVKDFKDKADQVRQASEPRSITDLEVRHAVLDSSRKRRSYFYLRTKLVPEPPENTTKETQDIYNDFVDLGELFSKLQALKSEITKCGRPVRKYPCDWEGKKFTKLETFGKMVLDDLWSGVLRDERYISKDIWKQVLGTEPDQDSRYTDETIPVPDDIAAKIVALAKPAPKDPLDAEREQMQVFANSRLRWFQGRTKELKELTNFINSTDENVPRLAVVAAVPGQGKSALMACLHEQLKASPDFVITHFVGTTERSASAHALVERLLTELDRSGIAWPVEEQKEGEEPKRDFNSLCLRLSQRLGNYAGERRIVILLDALNQLSDGHDLNWLPHRLGPSVRVIVSCIEECDLGVSPEDSDQSQARRLCHLTPEHIVLHALTSRQPLHVALGPLTESDIRTIVVGYLKEYCHELDREHLDTLCAIPQARNPLYLLVMLNELRTLGGNDLNTIVPALIASMPKDHPDTVSLFRWVLQRLEVFGPDVVRWWCLHLAHGRVGMASHELADLLARKLDVDAAATALRIERGLRRYLQRRGPQLDFFHGQLRQAVMEQYGPQAEPASVHHEMAEYFTACAKGIDPQKEWETESVRGFAECVFHLAKAGQDEQAAGLLSNFPFLLHKLRVGLLDGVFDDYGIFHCEVLPDVAKRVEMWDAFFSEKAHILRRGNGEWPAYKILLQLAVEHADDSPLTIGAEKWLAEGNCAWTWLCRNRRLTQAQVSPCLAVLEGHSSSVDGALELSGGRLLSWSSDSTLRLWDSRSGNCLAVLEGHSAPVFGALELSDGRLLSWSYDNTLRLWDPQSGNCLAVLEGHSESVNGALELSGGSLLSWADDNTLRIWDPQSGKCLAVLEGHSHGVSGALELSDGRLLSWSKDKTWSSDSTLRLWDSRSGNCLAILEGHSAPVFGALELSDGRILSWSSDNTLRLWDPLSGNCLAVLEGHSDSVCGLELSDGRILSWSSDNTLRLWDPRSGNCLAVLEGHSDCVSGGLELSNGRILSWSEDKTLRLWDPLSGKCLAVLKGHFFSVKGALELSDGRLLSWARTLHIWDPRSGKRLAVLEGNSYWVSGALELAGGHLLSWGPGGSALRLCKPLSGSFLSVLEGHSGPVYGALELADSRLLSWAGDSILRLWDPQSGKCLAVLEGHSGVVFGALELSDGRLLSWSNDSTLRLWDPQSGNFLAVLESGKCLAVLKGHSDSVCGAIELSNGCILSWSHDNTLRLWDPRSGKCLAVLQGHSRYVSGALELSGGRILSWSYEKTLRLWSPLSGKCLAVLEGHSDSVYGALELSDRRLLSRSSDGTLRLWAPRSGKCLAVLEGHSSSVDGALELSGGRLLSWSRDGTLRLWAPRSGKCLAVLEGHSDSIRGTLELSGGRLLSWADDKTLRLWDSDNGSCLEVVSEIEVSRRHPEWLHARTKAENSGSVARDFFIAASAYVSHLHHKTNSLIIAAWNANSGSKARFLLPDGTTVVTQENGQVCILKLYHGQRRITLAEAEAILFPNLRQESAAQLTQQETATKAKTPWWKLW